jgi:Flp pilus assembly protein TadD
MTRNEEVKAEALYERGKEFLKKGERLRALGLFDRAYNLEPDNPVYQSYLGLCIAYERRAMGEAVRLCEQALNVDPENPEHYLNLGKVYLVCGRNSDAVMIFRDGIKIDNTNPEIIAELHAMGIRKKQVVPFLKRENFLCKYLGIFFSRLGLR